MARHIMTLTCQDRPGIVAAVSAALLRAEANIVESQQFSDIDAGLFFLRTVFDLPAPDPAVDDAQGTIPQLSAAVTAAPAIIDPQLAIRPEVVRCKVLIMVSRFDHCLLDLLYRWKSGDLPVEVVGVVGNHDDCRELVEFFGVPFTTIPVTAETRQSAEAELFELIEQTGTELVVLARYMQVLSPELCERLSGRAINIHHSFLPGFKGARPYHQAHARGVKLIGASAHYVTADLDEGPIIEQDVVRVTHAETPAQLAELGRDVERRVLSQAVRAHADGRVFISGLRTVVF